MAEPILAELPLDLASMVINGDKMWLFSRETPGRLPDRVYICRPDGMVVCGADAWEAVKAPPEDLWPWCSDFAGISRADFMEFFDGGGEAFAVLLGEATGFGEPVDPAGLGLAGPPIACV